jgi:hypothetical protein
VRKRAGAALARARTPLIAAGAAAVGLAGTAAVKSRLRPRRKVLGISVPRRNDLTLNLGKAGFNAGGAASAVTDAAKRADRVGRRISGLANGVRQVSERAEEAAK